MRLRGLIAAAVGLAALAVAGPAGAGEIPAPRYSRTESFEVSHTRDKSANLATVELWFTADGGKTWNKAGDDPALSGRIVFKAPGEGTYGFVTVAVDKAGKRENEPAGGAVPTEQVIVDFTPPRVTASGPAEGALVKAAGEAQISWKAEDLHLGPSPVGIQMREDSGQEWEKVTFGYPAEGRRTVVLPQMKSGRVEFRVVARDLAGNLTTAPAGTVEVDSLPPDGRIIRPRLTGTRDVEIAYELKDQGPAGLASITIWQTTDDGRIWHKLADAPVNESTVKVRLPGQGTYGLAISATDKAGNALLPPGPGQKPAFTLICDTDPPRLKLTAPLEGATFAGGGPVRIEWTAEDANFDDTPTTVECSTDGGNSWTDVGRAIANTGRLEWKAPRIDSAKCLVRIWAVDKVGNRSVAVSRSFTVDSTAPTTRNPPVVPPPDEPPVIVQKPPTPPPPPPPPPEPTEAELLAKAEKFLDQGKGPEAAEVAGRAMLKNGRNPAAYLLRARALMASDPAAAARDLEMVVVLAPGTAGLYDLLGDAHYRAGVACLQKKEAKSAARELGRAAESFRKALSLNPDSWVRCYNLGVTLIGLARTEEKPELTRENAERELARALELAGPQDMAARAGIAWYQAILKEDQGDWATAAFFWRKAADLHGRESASGRKALENAGRAERRR